MQTQTAKMIYPTEQVANMIAGKLAKKKGKHIVVKIATGFQVCPVTVCQGAVSPHKATPIPEKIDHFSSTTEAMESMLSAVKEKIGGHASVHSFKGKGNYQVTETKTGKIVETVIVTLGFTSESPKYVNCFDPATGNPAYFGKSTLIAWEVSEDGKSVKLKMTKAVAKKRGLI